MKKYYNHLCACGCGSKLEIKFWHVQYHVTPKYIWGHNTRGKEKPKGSGRKEVKREIRTCASPKCNNTFVCLVTSTQKYCCKGHTWLGRHHITESRKKIGQVQLGRKQSVESNKKRSIRMKGRSTSERGHKSNCQCCICKNMRHELTSERNKKNWQNPKYVTKQMKSRGVSPNKLEMFLDRLLQDLLPNQYKYVGDGQVIIAGKCPDFISINGQKKIIELFGDYWHKPGTEQKRIDLFAKYGYQTLIIWEHELKDIDKLKERIIGFNQE